MFGEKCIARKEKEGMELIGSIDELVFLAGLSQYFVERYGI